MPTYSYACTACEHQFEAVQRFTDPSLTDCPVCSGRLRKLFSSVGIVFKGSGFYRTDSRTDSSTNRSEKPISDKSNSNGKSEDKSGTTPSESTVANGSKAPTSATSKAS